MSIDSHDVGVIRPTNRADAPHLMVCLGFCGGGTGGYRAWTDVVDAATELALVCYPGRDGRFSEPFARTWDELATDVTGTVLAAVDRPYTLFGHSMGGWMAYDVAARITAVGGPAPTTLVVSSCNAPSRGVTDRDRFPHPDDSDPELLAWMRTSGSLPDYALGDPDLCAMAIELMRADIMVRDSYRPCPDRRIDVPVHVLYGAEDPVIDPAVEEQWQATTGAWFRADRLPGGHFYTDDVWRRLPDHFPLPIGV